MKLASLKINNRASIIENYNPISKVITKTNNELDKGV
jgi:hypothetical protein